MEIEFLSHQQVCELTGAKQKAGQIAVLARNGIRHTIKANGWPCVTSVAVVADTKKVSEPKEKEAWKPRKVV